MISVICTLLLVCSPADQFDGEKLELTEKEWAKRLTPEQYRILRKGGTEAPFKNAYYRNEEPGKYLCAGCSLPLFSSDDKYDSGSGWPAFTAPICKENVAIQSSYNPFSSARGVRCARCDGHLGDVFKDGPPPNGIRYCIDSASLLFIALPAENP